MDGKQLTEIPQCLGVCVHLVEIGKYEDEGCWGVSAVERCAWQVHFLEQMAFVYGILHDPQLSRVDWLFESGTDSIFSHTVLGERSPEM